MPDIPKPQVPLTAGRGRRYHQALVWREIRRLARGRDESAERQDCLSAPRDAGPGHDDPSNAPGHRAGEEETAA